MIGCYKKWVEKNPPNGRLFAPLVLTTFVAKQYHKK